ncbi:hypothetical protein GWI33_018217 [Rhynchophorus ferrugineus]|uniref:Uncharacterized protein n=1 Tax=Rhynchophorus ferrugineus TaxID=354439 RepID=A0A834I0Q0_RHYFE|nr:hypothetical protein GWI33_018217 [Rhynchophorus ferrugineus]
MTDACESSNRRKIASRLMGGKSAALINHSGDRFVSIIKKIARHYPAKILILNDISIGMSRGLPLGPPLVLWDALNDSVHNSLMAGTHQLFNCRRSKSGRLKIHFASKCKFRNSDNGQLGRIWSE